MANTEILIDKERCICAQNCVRTAAFTFDIGDEDIVVILPLPHDERSMILSAIAACPVGAIAYCEPSVDSQEEDQ